MRLTLTTCIQNWLNNSALDRIMVVNSVSLHVLCRISMLTYFTVPRSKGHLRKRYFIIKFKSCLYYEGADFILTLGVNTKLSPQLSLILTCPSVMWLEGVAPWAAFPAGNAQSQCSNLHFQLAFVFPMLGIWAFNTNSRWSCFKTRI